MRVVVVTVFIVRVVGTIVAVICETTSLVPRLYLWLADGETDDRLHVLE
jgi:hypothetical protein